MSLCLIHKWTIWSRTLLGSSRTEGLVRWEQGNRQQNKKNTDRLIFGYLRLLFGKVREEERPYVRISCFQKKKKRKKTGLFWDLSASLTFQFDYLTFSMNDSILALSGLSWPSA